MHIRTMKKLAGVTAAVIMGASFASTEATAADQQFISIVADGRKMTRKEVHAVAQGRVWTGMEAKKVGLVDTLGGLGDAIRRARTDAQLGDRPAELVLLPSARPSCPARIRQVFAPDDTVTLGQALPADLRRAVPLLLSASRVWAAMPFVLDID